MWECKRAPLGLKKFNNTYISFVIMLTVVASSYFMSQFTLVVVSHGVCVIGGAHFYLSP